MASVNYPNINDAVTDNKEESIEFQALQSINRETYIK